MAAAYGIRSGARRTDKRPDNIISREEKILGECEAAENSLPAFAEAYYKHLEKRSAPSTRLAYLRDIRSFMIYLINETDLTEAEAPSEITRDEFNNIRASDINLFIRGGASSVEAPYKRKTVSAYSAVRRKASLSGMFRCLYKAGVIDSDITCEIAPVRAPEPAGSSSVVLTDDEVISMLDAAESGRGLSGHERLYWEKTRLRDRAVLLMLVTYGLSLSELHGLNLSSFDFSRGEFRIYRRRGREAVMPLNRSVTAALTDYISDERSSAEKTGDGAEDALFLSLQGRRITEKALRQLVKKYTAIARGGEGQAGCSPHDLRVTAAEALRRRGVSEYDADIFFDREHVSMAELYAQQKTDVRREIIKIMEWEPDVNAPE